jgi:hypothetical protein
MLDVLAEKIINLFILAALNGYRRVGRSASI